MCLPASPCLPDSLPDSLPAGLHLPSSCTPPCAVVATVELVNSSSVEVQCTGAVPTVAVDKCDGCQVGGWWQAGGSVANVVRAATGRQAGTRMHTARGLPLHTSTFPPWAPAHPHTHTQLCLPCAALEPTRMQQTSSIVKLSSIKQTKDVILCYHYPSSTPHPTHTHTPQLYLPRGSLEVTDITTAKSSEVNVVVPGASGGQPCPPACCRLPACLLAPWLLGAARRCCRAARRHEALALPACWPAPELPRPQADSAAPEFCPPAPHAHLTCLPAHLHLNCLPSAPCLSLPAPPACRGGRPCGECHPGAVCEPLPRRQVGHGAGQPQRRLRWAAAAEAGGTRQSGRRRRRHGSAWQLAVQSPEADWSMNQSGSVRF